MRDFALNVQCQYFLDSVAADSIFNDVQYLITFEKTRKCDNSVGIMMFITSLRNDSDRVNPPTSTFFS